MGAIHEALVKIKQDVGAVAKDGYNQHQKFNFRSIDGIYNAVHSIFAKHGVYTVPRVVGTAYDSYESKNGGAMFRARVMVEYDLVAGDGSREKFGPVAGEGTDSGDKATSKALAMAHKYMLIQALQLETQSDDPDADTAPPARGNPVPPNVPPRQPSGPPPADPPAGKAPDLAETRRKLVESMTAWVSGDKVRSKKIVAFILPGHSSISQLPDALVRRYSLGWWLYRILNGDEKAIREWMDINCPAWFDKLDDAGLDKLKQSCAYEDERQKNAAAGLKTTAPSIKDENGDDPF